MANGDAGFVMYVSESVFTEEGIFRPCLTYLLKLINRVQKKMDNIVPRAKEVWGQVTTFSSHQGNILEFLGRWLFNFNHKTVAD